MPNGQLVTAFAAEAYYGPDVVQEDHPDRPGGPDP